MSVGVVVGVDVVWLWFGVVDVVVVWFVRRRTNAKRTDSVPIPFTKDFGSPCRERECAVTQSSYVDTLLVVE